MTGLASSTRRAVRERLVRFGLVGTCATGVQYLILVVMVRGVGMWPPAASAVGFAVSAVGSYILNYHFTFRSREHHGPAAVKFLIMASSGLALNAALMGMLVGLGWHYLAAQVCVTVVVFLWNFLGNSLWTFRAQTSH